MDQAGDEENEVGFGLQRTTEAECWRWTSALRVRPQVTNGEAPEEEGVSPKVSRAERAAV